MMNFIIVEKKQNYAEVFLNREEIHNAFNDELINELKTTFLDLEKDSNIRVVVLTGKGRSFCAGADLNWMKSMVDYSFEENKKDSENLESLFQVINSFKKPLIGKINGHALGGGVGLVSVCDYAITHEKAKFGFTEARLGLIPAVISPYVIRKIGESQARAWFLSGERFDASEAMRMNLIHQVTTLEEFEEKSKEVIDSFLQAAPNASMAAKRLITEVLGRRPEEVRDYTTSAIADKRTSEEGQEGMKAMLEKRKANWLK